ncbi:DUF928 domain-containing protein [Pantanalinema sp. GBBB05]|uniref:DUF928 domain-containing protein n=1 Tax=Pantanalinema sp. GBBB05 TaxID=2604139 RepID=UPI003D8145D4
MALLPGKLVKTVARPPVILIYLPPHTAPRTEIVLARDAGFTHVIYRQQFDLPESAGLLRVPFLDDAGLGDFIPDELYYWRFTLIYAIRGRGEPEAIAGSIQPVTIAPEMQAQLHQASLQGRVELYQSLKLPYDAGVELDSLRRANPDDAAVQELWSTWVTTQGWADLVTVPTIG